MVDSRLTPDSDAFASLLGLSATTGSREETASTGEAPAAFPTRREVRAQYAAAASVSPSKRFNRRDARAAGRVSARQNATRQNAARPASARRSARNVAVAVPAPEQSRSGRRVAVPVAAPEYLLPFAKRRKPKLRPLFTILIVGGLFTSAGLPAYALTNTGDVASAAQVAASVDSQSVLVSSKAKLEPDERGAYTATAPADLAKQRSDFTKQANWDAYQTSGAQELGDDYPWFSELSNNQGGGLSPLNYFYRECVDFVAWRLNRDAGSTSAPFLYDWNYLTPGGGNASAWAGAWKAHGWPTGSTPVVGSVAWFTGNHVAYVAKVNDDGTVLIEEYNHGSDHKYGQRTIPATDVALYLYAPPR